jgi:energy-coupling factor transporter ATP-binding protein EcfA2
MEITEIKARLSLSDVLRHYGLKADKQERLCCPFHEDKTPSLQLYYKTQTAYCFSSNCKTHGKSMDVIDFIMYKENCSKHEAIGKAGALAGGQSRGEVPERITPVSTGQAPGEEKSRFLGSMFHYFCNAIHNSKPAQDYLAGRCLNYRTTGVGYNSGQFHHGARRDETLIAQCLETGLLIDKGARSSTGDKAYTVFGKWCICFALRDREGRITGLYFRSTIDDKDRRHFYLKNRSGLYPHYPCPDTKRLILTESIIDAATLLQIAPIREQYGVLACYGTNGLTEEHRRAIKELSALEEIIFAFDNDAPGREATGKYAAFFREEYPKIKLRVTDLPCKDINETAQGHESDIFLHLLDTRKPCALTSESGFSFSMEESTEKKNPESQNIPSMAPSQSPLAGESKTGASQPGGCLDSSNPYNLHYRGQSADYYVKGGLSEALDSMKVSLQVVGRTTGDDYRAKLDLYEYRQVNIRVKAVAARLGIAAEELEKELQQLCSCLEEYRGQRLQNRGTDHRPAVHVPEATVNKCVEFLRSGDLIDQINRHIGQSGVTGESINRLFLFVIASSYKMPDTLHALIQGSSGSGKTRLLKIITEVMPPEDTIRFTRVTDSSFYNYPENYLTHKLLGFEDIDGLKEEALYAVRELISNEILTSSTSSKTEQGQIVAQQRIVRGPIASISCTTKGHIYEDNMSRVFLLSVDESPQQTRRIIDYQQQKAGGQIEGRTEKQHRELLQNCVRLLKPYPVVNPYAGKLHLPVEVHKIRRLNDLYLSFVRQITLINQYQRKRDEKGRLITQREDLQRACDIMFESIVLKVDELDGSLRQFYEQLKQYLKKHPEQENFILRDIRQSLRISKSQLHRYINELLELEYIQQTAGNAARGYKYKITYWDNVEALRSGIRQNLQRQIEKLAP